MLFWLLYLILAGSPAFSSSGIDDEIIVREPVQLIDHCSAWITAGPSWSESISFPEIEKVLAEGKILGLKPLEADLKDPIKRTNPALLVTFPGGVRGLWKSNFHGSMYAETGAYQVNYYSLKSKRVPPTVERNLSNELLEFLPELRKGFPKKEGSLQYYVDSPFDLTQLDHWTTIWPLVKPTEKSDWYLFVSVFGQTDNHRGNLIVDRSLSLGWIDNTRLRQRSKIRFGEIPYQRLFEKRLPYVIEGQEPPFSFDSAIEVRPHSLEELHLALDPWVISQYVDFYWKQLQKQTNRTFAYVLWDQGVWIQSRGWNGIATKIPKIFSKATLDSYRSLNFPELRERLSPKLFRDVYLHEILERRDEMVAGASKHTLVP